MEEDEALWSDFVKEGPDVEVYTSSVILLGALQQNAWTLLVRKILNTTEVIGSGACAFLECRRSHGYPPS